MSINRPRNNPWQNIETEIRVKDVNQNTLSPEELENYKDIILTENQAQRLEQWRLTTEELSWLMLEQLRTDIDRTNSTQEAINRWREVNQRWNTEQQESRNWAERLLDSISSSTNNIQSNLNWNISEITSWLKEWWIMLWIEKIEKKWWFLWNIASVILKIAWFFWYKSKVSEAVDSAENSIREAISEENINNTKSKVKDLLIWSLWESITEENRLKVENLVENLNEDQISRLYEKIKNWELTLNDIITELPQAFNDILDEAQIEQLKDDIKNKIINSLKKEIKENYWIDLDLDDAKLAELEELVSSNLRINESNISQIKSIVESREFRYKDLEPIAWEVFTNWFNIIFWLFKKQILPVSAFLWDFVSDTWNIIKIAAWALWIWWTITLDEFVDSIKDLPQEQKSLIIWMLYRKWWLFLSIIWGITEMTSKLLIWAVSDSTVSWVNLFSASATNNFSRQASNLDRISQSLWQRVDHNAILREAITNLKKVQENYKIIDIISKSNWNKERALNLLREANIDLRNINISWSIDDLISSLSQKNIVRVWIWDRWSITSSLWFWAKADLYRLNKKLEMINSSQRRMFNPNFITNWYLRIKEAFAATNVSRMWDRLAFHFQNQADALKWIKQLNVLANRSPELIRWTIDKLPIITVAWLAMHSEWPFFEEMRNNMLYLLPITWPILMLRETWWTWDNWVPMPIDPISAWIWWALLTLDAVILAKEITRNWVRWWWAYLIKPIKDLYTIWRWTLDLWYSVWKAVMWWWSITWAARESLNKTKSIKNWKVRALVILWLTWWAWVSYAINSNEQDIKDIFENNGDINFNILEELRESLSEEEKEEIANSIIRNSFELGTNLEWIDIKITNNKLNITSNNPNFKNDWFIDTEIIELLWLESEIIFNYNW